MKQFLALLFVACIFCGSFAQNAEREPLQVKYDMNLGIYFNHVLAQGESAYKAGNDFGVKLPVLRATNPDLDLDNLPPDQVIKIPVFVNKIQPKGSGGRQLIYEVNKQETLYTIAKIYFKRKVHELKRWNNLQNNALNVGQHLVVGYMHFPSTTIVASSVVPKNEPAARLIKEPEDRATVSNVPQHQDQQAVNTSDQVSDEVASETIGSKKDEKSILDIIDLISDTTSSAIDQAEVQEENMVEVVAKRVDEEGVAFTEQLELSGNDFFVLHPKAKVNSKMTLIYPMLSTEIEAKVIGTLPQHLYPSNISVVISPSVAVKLGAKDKQFKVKMSYIENPNVDTQLYSSLGED